jgi:hypothetical protein
MLLQMIVLLFAAFSLMCSPLSCKMSIVRETFRQMLLAADRTSSLLHSNRWCSSLFLFSQAQCRLYFHNTQGRPVTCGRPGQVSVKSDIPYSFSTLYRPGEPYWQRGRSKIADNFRRNSSAFGNLSLLSPYFGLFEWRLNAPRSCPAGPPDASRWKTSDVLNTRLILVQTVGNTVYWFSR